MNMNLLLIIITITIPTIAHLYVSYNFKKYKKTIVKSEVSGFECARKIMDEHDMNDVYITAISGKYSDHYNSSRKVIKLSKQVFNDSSITSISIASFESKKALLDKSNDSAFKFKDSLNNLFKYASYLGYLFILIGLFLAVQLFFSLGIVLEILNLLFHLITIKVDFKIARGALDELLEQSIISSEENEMVKSVLSACAYKNLAFLIDNVIEVGIMIYDFGSSK